MGRDGVCSPAMADSRQRRWRRSKRAEAGSPAAPPADLLDDPSPPEAPVRGAGPPDLADPSPVPPERALVVREAPHRRIARRALSSGVATQVRRLVPARRGAARSVPSVGHTGHAPLDPEARLDADGRPILDVLTLNLAHGRSTGFHQAFLRAATIRRNLDAVAALLSRERPDIVAFQEADGPSAWSGRFDHVDYLACAAGFSHHLRGTHMAAPRTRYGTAIAARLPLADPLSVTFAPSPPTFSKGFVVSTVLHPALPDVPIDVVSVHLDFARPVVRRRQVETLIETLRGRDRLMVVLGDFNTRWDAREHTLRRLAAALGLEAHAPDEPLVTFPFHGTRLDWIFASKPIAFVDHRVLPDEVSDHRAVFARIRLPG